jgi:GNAT superfamily N-acetyltransferase
MKVKDTEGLRIRAGEAGDLVAIERIVAAAYGKYVARMGKKPGPMLDDYAAHIADATLSVITLENDIAGLIVLCPEAECLLLDNVAVDPAMQGHGLGRALMEFAQAEAKRQGFARLRLYTHVSMTENIALYARLGWRETHRGAQDGYDRVFFEKNVHQSDSPT